MRRYLRSEIVKLPRVHRVRKSGKVFKYHKITRAPLPNDVPEDHPDFIVAWTAEEAQKPKPKVRSPQGSIGYGVARYLRSDGYNDLSKEYAAKISRNVREIGQSYGAAMMIDLRTPHIQSDINKFKGNPRADREKAWRSLCDFWLQEAWTTGNPSNGMVRAPRVRTRGHIPWSPAEITLFREKYPIGGVERLCMELLYWTAARTVDAVNLGPRKIQHDGLLVFTQSKTEAEAFVPWKCALKPWALVLEPDRQMLMECLPNGVFTFLETARGKPRSKKGLSNVISEAARKIGLEKRSAHGLRKSRLISLAEAGADVHAIMSWGGHKTLSEAQKYIEEANRRKVLIGTEQDQNIVNPADPGGKLREKQR